MTELEHIEIEGFKGLEHVEFEPTDINLITGRNNTGKTSFLESISFLFNPNYIQNFSDNIDNVVNVGFDQSRILGEWDEDDLEVHLKTPSPSEVRKWFIEVSPHIVDYEMYDSLQLRFDESLGRFESLSERFSDVVRDIIEDEVTEDDVKNIRNEFLVIQSEGEQFPYFSAGNGSRAIIEDDVVRKRLENELREKIKSEGEVEGVQSTLKEWAGSVQDSGGVRFKKRRGFLTPPVTRKNVNFIESSNLTGDIQRTDDEKDAIKVDDIGDFIEDAGFIDGLKTFTLDYLVFEEDGEKRQIPYEFMGDGFKIIVGLLWELMDEETENEIVLIEEPETHMHPGYVAELVHFLIDLARDEDIQFFITTHDHDFIKDFFMDMPDEKREYLEGEFSLVKMDDFGADVMEYEEAEHHLKDLHLDLRGI